MGKLVFFLFPLSNTQVVEFLIQRPLFLYVKCSGKSETVVIRQDCQQVEKFVNKLTNMSISGQICQ